MAKHATAPTALRMQPVRVSPTAPRIAPTGMIAIIVVGVGALYFGREILIPLALSILLSFALAPIAIRLRRWGLGRVPSVLAVVLIVFVGLIGFGALVATQIVDLAGNLPTYERNIRAKIQALRSDTPEKGVVEQASDMLHDLNQELKKATKEPAEGVEGRSGPSGQLQPGQFDVVKPVPVEVQEPDSSPLVALEEVASPLVGPLATAGLVLVFVIFMLLQREDLRDRLIRLVGTSDIRRTTEAMDDAAQRVSRYLLMQLIINTLYGVAVGVGLYFIGVPNPLLWGLLATVLRFIPYVGPVVAALVPIALSLAVDRGWTMPMLTVGLFLVLELFINNVLEPWLYGSSTGLSPVAIIVAAIFWTTLWGPVGLLLATPLTVCLVVLGRHVPQLQFLDVLLGNEPVLPTEVKFYQRLLARDPDEAEQIADEYRDENSLPELYEDVIMPAVGLAEQDRVARGLDREAVEAIAEDILDVIDEVAEEDDLAAAEGEEGPRAHCGRTAQPCILCIGPRNGLDMAAATMLTHLLLRRDLGAKTVPGEAVSVRKLSTLEREGIALVCLCYANPAALQHARRLTRRLRLHFGRDVRILSGFWNAEGEPQSAAAITGSDVVAISLRQAVREAEEIIKGEATPAPTSPAPAPAPTSPAPSAA